jgi:ABC-type Fe3+ transport system substrate-binding protein
VTWPHTGAILKDAPHPEAAKLLHSWILSKEHQNVTGTWSVLKDFPAPAGYSPIMEQVGTDPTKFSQFMADRAAVERLRLFFEERIGTAQGLSPLIDGI